MVFFVLFIFALVPKIIQSETKSCTQKELCECLQDESCQLECIGSRACEGTATILSCRSGHPCTITCQDDRSCKNAHINANGASSLSLECDGGRACENTIVDCNNADNCDIICSLSDPNEKSNCKSLELGCSTSMCSLDCETQDTCDAIIFDVEEALSFECFNNCPDSVPSAFIRTTTEPIHSTSTETHSITSTETLKYETETHISTTTSADNGITTTEIHRIDQEVAVETTDIAVESNTVVDGPTQHNIMDLVTLHDIWIYIAFAICGVVFCCLSIVTICALCRMGKDRKRSHTKDIHIPKYAGQKAIPSATVTNLTMTPVSQSGSSVALTPATMTPVTPVKIRNLSVIKDDAQYTNTFPDTLNSGFSVYLSNEVLAGSMVMDDVMHCMSSTPGHMDVDVDDNMGMHLEIEMNPMKEGDTYTRDNPLLNDDDDDDDDILDIVNGTTINGGETCDDDIDVDDIDFGDAPHVETVH